MIKQVALSVAGIIGLALLGSIGCTKTPPPVHDTVTVIKKDTLTDTIYATKPDPTVNLKNGLLVYLPFSGNIADSSGNNNPTRAVGSVLAYDAHGYANSAFGATGNGEKIYVTNNGSIKFDTAFSVSFGFMVNDGRKSTFACFVNPANAYAPSFNIGVTIPNLPYFGFGTGDIADTTSLIPVTGAWYNAVCIYHKGGAKIYINGKLAAFQQGIGTQANLCPASQLIIGAWWDGDPQGMNGKIDNFRLYNRVLTTNEIAILSSSYQVTSNSVKQVISK
jgi:hypothetical protein